MPLFSRMQMSDMTTIGNEIHESSSKRAQEPDGVPVCIVINQAETEYDGSFTGDVETTMVTIAEQKLKSRFGIELKTSLEIVDGNSERLQRLVKASHTFNRKHRNGPFSKVLVINVHRDGDADPEYERESEA